jgi:hypothetical protein
VALVAGPDWLGSPQHFVGGLALALAVVAVARLLRLGVAVACVVAVGVASAAEIVIELFEYPVRYSDHPHASAYYDTLADMGNTLVGALAGVAVVLVFVWRRSRRARVAHS